MAPPGQSEASTSRSRLKWARVQQARPRRPPPGPSQAPPACDTRGPKRPAGVCLARAPGPTLGVTPAATSVFRKQGSHQISTGCPAARPGWKTVFWGSTPACSCSPRVEPPGRACLWAPPPLPGSLGTNLGTSPECHMRPGHTCSGGHVPVRKGCDTLHRSPRVDQKRAQSSAECCPGAGWPLRLTLVCVRWAHAPRGPPWELSVSP